MNHKELKQKKINNKEESLNHSDQNLEINKLLNQMKWRINSKKLY